MVFFLKDRIFSMEKDILEILLERGVVHSSEVGCQLLSGGVSSHIFKVTDDDHTYVVKQALRKLKVERDWFADINRNNTEQDFLRFMESYLSHAVPAVVYADREHHFFVMEYLDDRYINWKSRLLAGKFDEEVVGKTAKLLAQIHNISRKEDEWREVFDGYDNFYDLRIEPYFIHTARRYPELESLFLEESDRLRQHHEVLIHGDFSPKNIMIHPEKVVILDHEVACYGDPAFDLSFLLCHLFLKMIYHYFLSGKIYDVINTARSVYTENAMDPDLSGLEYRSGRLLLMMLLARIDGKSPVEYLKRDGEQFVRTFASEMLRQQEFSLAEINRICKVKLKSW